MFGNGTKGTVCSDSKKLTIRKLNYFTTYSMHFSKTEN